MIFATPFNASQISHAAYPCPLTPGHIWQHRNHLVAILSATNHLPQFVFLGELALKLIKLSHEILARPKYSFFGSNLTIGLNSKLEIREERMRDLKRSQHFLCFYRQE